MSAARPTLTGVVLAGGQARRMGGQDKGLIALAGRPLVAHALDILRPQVDALLINANRNLERYAALGVPVVSDRVGDFFGPLAGMAAALEAASTDAIVTLPCDSPLAPPDLAQRLLAALERETAELAVAHDGMRLQPVFALVPKAQSASLHAFLETGERKIDRWYAQHRMARADFSDCPEAFANVNAPEDLQALEAELRGRG
jgi:molybdenum cofactor guanylyltransferase